MVKKNKVVLAVVVALFLSVSFYFHDKSNETLEIPPELEALNTKYNLVAASAIDDKNVSPYLGSMLSSSVFTANSFMANQDYEEENLKTIIVKVGKNKVRNDLSNVMVLDLATDVSVEQIVADYEKLSVVKFAEEDSEINLEVGLNDENQPDTTELNAESNPYDIILGDMLRESEAKRKAQLLPEEPIVVAVVDSGADTGHPELLGRFVEGRNFIDDTADVSDELGHGTHVSGIVLNNSANAVVMPLKFTDAQTGKLSDVIRAVKYAVDNDADVINLSLGLQDDSQSLKTVVDYALENEVVVVAAAGNNGSDSKYYPAAWDDVIAVGAVTLDGVKTENSNYGDWVDFAALGYRVLSTEPDGKYSYRTGTSQAAPFVAAKVADSLYNFEVAALAEVDLEEGEVLFQGNLQLINDQNTVPVEVSSDDSVEDLVDLTEMVMETLLELAVEPVSSDYAIGELLLN